LQILNLTWEDTARFKGSAVGPNISDMTIQVRDMLILPRVPRVAPSALPGDSIPLTRGLHMAIFGRTG
jgi:hypothetical protein